MYLVQFGLRPETPLHCKLELSPLPIHVLYWNGEGTAGDVNNY